MSDPYNPAAPAARPRPSSVTISSYLLFLVALLFAIGAIVGLATLGTVTDVYRDAYQDTSVEGAEGFVTGVGAVGAVVQLLFAAAFVALALLNNRGRNGSRITTWVLGGLGVCCTGLNLVGSAFSGMNAGSSGDMPDAAEVQRRLDEALPGYVEPVSMASSIIALLALLAAVVLLAMPASNEFFRKPQAAWEPPVPGAAYPGQPSAGPGYPPAGGPGYPPAGGPGYPPAGGPGYPPQGPGGYPSAASSGEPGYPPVPPPANQPPSSEPSPGDRSEPPSDPAGPPAR